MGIPETERDARERDERGEMGNGIRVFFLAFERETWFTRASSTALAQSVPRDVYGVRSLISHRRFCMPETTLL